jgi:hypothetical protein
MEHATVSTQLPLSLLSADGEDLPVVAKLRYSAQDPLAVEALFHDGSPDPVRWVFARDLLARGRPGPPHGRRRCRGLSHPGRAGQARRAPTTALTQR